MRTRWGCETQRHYAYAKSEVYGLDLRTLNILFCSGMCRVCEVHNLTEHLCMWAV